MSAVLVLGVFVVFAGLMYVRWLPAIVAVPFMALCMALAAGVPVAQLGDIITNGAAALAPVYVAVIFGAMLGRVTLDSGIARAMVNLAAEYGGENPLVLALVLCAVVAVLFTSLAGLGGMIMVGSIVLPIMMTTGVPRTIASTLFLMAFALGYIFNITSWTFYTTYFGVVPEQLMRYAVVLAVVDAVGLILYAIVSFQRERGYATWSMRAKPEERGLTVPPIALITPFVPLVLYYALHIAAAPAFIIAALFGVLVTQPRDAVQKLLAAAIRGVEDVAPAILLFMSIGMLLIATKEPQFTAALRPLVAGDWLRNPIPYVAVFGLGSPLVLYRGPLNPFGVGIAIFTVLLTAHVLPPVVLVAAVMAVVQVQNVCDPTNTGNVWVANFTGVPIDTITKRTLPYQTAVATLATLAVVLAAPGLFGIRAFAAMIASAGAAEIPVSAGFYAPAKSRNRLAVDDDTTSLGRVAADAVARALDDGTLHAFRLHDDPNHSDCSGKLYTAYILVETSQFKLVEGDDLDVGLRLEDCGGWIVDEWHDHRIFANGPTPADARVLALEGVARLRGWATAARIASGNLFTEGVAAQPGDPPTYFYTLFKSDDGNLRAYVRAGGPAYRDGLRSGEIVEQIDGRDWWNYGTYQAQEQAYDGKPHRFEVLQGNERIEVQLQTPFVVPRSADTIGRLVRSAG